MQADVRAERSLGATGYRWAALRVELGSPAGLATERTEELDRREVAVDLFHEPLDLEVLCHGGRVPDAPQSALKRLEQVLSAFE